MMQDILVKAFIPLVLCGVLSNCTTFDYCALPADDSPYAPYIEQVTQLTEEQMAELAAVNTMGDDPWLIVMNLAFSDNNGDLGRGTLAVSIEKQEAYRIDMRELFKERALNENATSGEVPLLLRLVPKEGIGEEAAMHVGLSLIDEAGLVSNCHSLNIFLRRVTR